MLTQDPPKPLSGKGIGEQQMDAVRTTARVITRTALIAAAVTERVAAAALSCAVDRVRRFSPQRAQTPSARDWP